jgi:hypothetical protein
MMGERDIAPTNGLIVTVVRRISEANGSLGGVMDSGKVQPALSINLRNMVLEKWLNVAISSYQSHPELKGGDSARRINHIGTTVSVSVTPTYTGKGEENHV